MFCQLRTVSKLFELLPQRVIFPGRHHGSGIAIVSDVCVFGVGETTQLLVASQVVLNMWLGFAVWPLMGLAKARPRKSTFRCWRG
jgi:hypothetical protein